MKEELFSSYLKNMTNVTKSLLFLVVFVLATPLFAQKKSGQLKQEQKRLEEKIGATQSLLSATQKNATTTLQGIKLIDQNILFREQLLANIDQQLRVSELKINSLANQVESLSKTVENLKKQYKTMLLAAYKNRSKYNRMMFVFSSESFNQAFKRMKYLEKIKEVRIRQVLLIKQNQKLITKKIVSLKEERQKSQLLAQSKIKERKSLEQAKTEQQEIYKNYKVKEEELIAQLKEVKQKRERIKIQIRKAIERELAIARKKAEAARKEREKKAKEMAKTNPTETPTKSPPENTGAFGLTAEAKIIGTDFRGNKGRLPWPVERGTITEGYGKNPHPTVANVYTNNYGIDISAPKGANVRAVYKGVVSSVLSIPGAGRVIIIKHGNFRTVYSNLKNVYVDKGAKVSTKQAIGSLLETGNISVSHFEIHEVTESGVHRLNPSLWISN